MKHEVTSFLAEQHIHLHGKRILLAVSGGMDSVALVEIMRQLNADFGIAHCNFQLRGEESMGDEAGVKELAEKYKVPFYSIRFDTAAYTEAKKVSTQVAARDLRYQWFEEIRRANKYDYLATAHHLNDNIETVLMNFIKGTGVKGLRGMQAKNGLLIRPLLSTSRKEIEAFQKEHQLSYREDSSNVSDKYTRNKIRHHLVPLIEEINPGFETGFADRLKTFADLERIYEGKVNRVNKQLFEKRNRDIFIPIRLLKKLSDRRSILFEYLLPLGFNASQVDDILSTLDGDSGKQFLSPLARVIKDRRFLIVTTLSNDDFTTVLVNKDDAQIKLSNCTLDISIKDSADLTIKKEKQYAYLDLDKLAFPLTLRLWRKGDYFYPFGMALKKKKVSKYFKDIKLSINQKEKIWILESDKKIAWIVGERIDERSKVTEKTKRVLIMKKN